jgi:hypothetical protein
MKHTGNILNATNQAFQSAPDAVSQWRETAAGSNRSLLHPGNDNGFH